MTIPEKELEQIRKLETKAISLAEFKRDYDDLPAGFLKIREKPLNLHGEMAMLSTRKFEEQVWAEFLGMVFDGNLGEILRQAKLNTASLLGLICEKLFLLLCLQRDETLLEAYRRNDLNDNPSWQLLKKWYEERITRKTEAALTVHGLSFAQSGRIITDSILLAIASLQKIVRGGESVGFSLIDGRLSVKESRLTNYINEQTDLIRFRKKDAFILRKTGSLVEKVTGEAVAARVSNDRSEYKFWLEHKSTLISEVYGRLNNNICENGFVLYSGLGSYVNGIVKITMIETYRKETEHIKKHTGMDLREKDDDQENDSPGTVDEGLITEFDDLFSLAGGSDAIDPAWAPFRELYEEASKSVPAEQLELLIAKYKLEITTSDLAQLNEINENAIGSRLDRAKKALWREICKSAAKRKLFFKKCHE